MACKIFVLASLAVFAHAGIVAPAGPVVAKLVDSEFDPNPQYTYAYDVQDSLTGDSKNQFETRNGDVVQGRYSLIEADGTRRIVDYTADPVNGFNAVVQREPLVKAAVVAPAAPVVAKVVAPAPYVAPVAKYVAPAPVVASPFAKFIAAPSPVVAPAPYVAPVAKYVAPAPVVASPFAKFIAAPAPVVAPARYLAPAPARFFAPAPVARFLAPAPLVAQAPIAKLAAPLSYPAPLAYNAPVAKFVQPFGYPV